MPVYPDDVTGVCRTPQGYCVDDADAEAFDNAFPAVNPKAGASAPQVMQLLPGK